MEAKLEATQAQIRSGLSEPKPEEMLFGFGEFQGFMSGPPHTTGNSSFTALLELPPPQAVELLVKEDFPDKPLPPPPVFPSNFALIDRDSSFSAFALASMSMKQEPLDSDMDPQPDSSSPASNQSQKSTKRKEREKKVKESNKKGKRVEANEGACEGGGEKLPYVHVRARRGQATDSHSLAERARREKINARMKLLQELVPGCNKGRKIKLIAFTPRKGDGPPLKRPSRNSCIVSGTAMVLDEIINHVQALQRQVEFLSMRLAAVDPRIDFNLDALLAAESGSSIDNSYSGHIWPEGQIDGIRQQQYQQLLHVDGLHQPIWAKEEDDTTNFISLKDSRSIYDSSANSGSLHSSQLKMEL